MDIFENICRTCGNDCLDAINIFGDSVVIMEKNLPITEILVACNPASLPRLRIDDEYPKQICRVCIKKLIMIYEFNNKWLTANNEFGVALKFEQRRNRPRVPQSAVLVSEQNPSKLTVKTLDANDQVIDGNIKAESIVFKHETNEIVEMKMVSEKKQDHDLITKSNLSIAQSPNNFQCALCEEQFHTLAAYRKHHKVSHRDCHLIYYTPGQ